MQMACNNIYWILGGLPKKGDKIKISKLKNNITKCYIIGKNINFFKKQIKGKLDFSITKNLKNSINQILKDINSLDKPKLIVFNKIDLYEPDPWDETDLVEERTKNHYSLEEWQKTWMHRINNSALFISAVSKENLDLFRERVYEATRKIHITRFPYNNFLYTEQQKEI